MTTCEDTVGDDLVDCGGHPPGLFGREPVAQRWLVVGKEALGSPDRGVDRILVMALTDRGRQSAPAQRRRRQLAEPPENRSLEQRTNVVAADAVERGRDGPSGCRRGPLGVPGSREPDTQTTPDLGRTDALSNQLGRQELLLDEPAELCSELVLLPRDDRGVGNGQAERMPEQRDDGEPVGDRADDCSLGSRPDVRDPRVVLLVDPGDDEHRGCDDQQAQRDALHPA